MIATENYVGQPLPTDGDVFKSMFENNPLPMWIYDLETLRFLAVNEAAVRRYGYSRSEFLGMSTNDLRAREEIDVTSKSADGRPVVKEWHGWRHRLRNGEVIEVELITQGLKYEGRRAAFVIVNGVYGRGFLRSTPEGSDEGLSLSLGESTEPVILFEPGTGKIVDANQAAATLYGYERERLCALTLPEVMVSVNGKTLVSVSDSSSILSGANIVSTIRLANGETHDVQVRGSEIIAGKNKLVHLVLVAAQPAAVESTPPASTADEVLNFLPQGYYRQNENGDFIEVNPAFAAMLGYTREELLLPGAGSLIIPVSAFYSRPVVNAASGVGSDKYHLRKKDGTEIFVEDFSRVVRDTRGIVLYREGFCRETEEEHPPADGSGKYETLFNELSDMMLLVRMSDRKILEANRAVVLAHGYTREELIGKSMDDLRIFDNWGAIQQRMNDAQAEGFLLETVHRRKDGTSLPVEARMQRIYIDGDEVVLSVSRDMSKRIKSEVQLRLSEEKYRSIFEKSPFGILQFDVNGVVTDCNESLAAIMGSSRASVIGLKLLDLPSKELVGAVRNVLEGRLGIYEGEYRSFTASKSIHVKTTFTAILAGDGKPAGGIGMFEDITERERASDALRESERRYRLLYENSPVPYHLLDSNWRIVDVNPTWLDLLGYKKAEVLEKDFGAFVSPEHVSLLNEKMESFKVSGELGNLEVDLVPRVGRRITVAIEGKILRNPDGGIQQAQFMLYDVTERKMAEDALRESEQKFRSLAESASSAIFMYQNNKICYVNAACIKITGFGQDELLSMAFWDIVHPDFRELVKELGLARQRGESVPNHFELKVQTKAGETRWVDFTAATTTYKGEVAVLGTVYDVTERRNVKKQLEEAEGQQKLIVDKSPDVVMFVTSGKVVYANPASLRMLSIGAHDGPLGKSFDEFVHPDSRQRLSASFEEIRKNSRPVELASEKLIRRDGSAVAVSISAVPLTYLGEPSIQIVARDVTGQMNVKDQLRLQNVALNSAANAIAVTNPDGTLVWANPAFETLTGYSAGEATGRNVLDLTKSGEHDERFFSSLWDTIRSGNVWHDELVCRRKSGVLYTEDLTITPVKDDKGEVTHCVWVKQDVTMRKSFEEQLFQAKKLEGIGQLAGGIAHDYNNILGVILGYGELLRGKLNEKDPARMPVDAILTATRKGADLTKQLLAFAQVGVMSPRIVDVNKAIDTMQGMLHRIAGENCKFEFTPLKSLWNVKMDPTHLDQMLVNLAANARDALVGTSGSVEIKTSNVVVDELFVRKHVGFTPGEYVMISFSDTGKGMDRTIQERIFEPFFTTKQKGQASGLGLATVYGIVKRNNGAITVRSKLGEGTTFCIYLPRFDQEEAEPVETIVSSELLRSNETVLLVEDQADLLGLVKENLEEYGYKVMTALGAEEALAFCEAYPEKIDILVTDVMLPGLNGKDLSERITASRPGMKTLFMSGYSADALAPEGVLGENVDFLQKPFTAYELAKKVHKVLYP